MAGCSFMLKTGKEWYKMVVVGGGENLKKLTDKDFIEMLEESRNELKEKFEEEQSQVENQDEKIDYNTLFEPMDHNTTYVIDIMLRKFYNKIYEE